MTRRECEIVYNKVCRVIYSTKTIAQYLSAVKYTHLFIRLLSFDQEYFKISALKILHKQKTLLIKKHV